MKKLVISLVLLFGTLAYGGEKVLYSFQGGTDGYNPNGALVSDQAGNFYGTTLYGGNTGCKGVESCGTVFELSPDGHGGWTEAVLYRFTGGSDGQNPLVGLTRDSQGNLYGTTLGPFPCAPYCGSVFELSPEGNAWTFTVLHAFQGKKDGGTLEGGVTMDAAGNLYGTTRLFGAKNDGTAFRLSKSGRAWTFTTLHAFDNSGSDPVGTLVIGTSGMIYGVTFGGGLSNVNAGVFYSLSLNAKGKWIENVLYPFKGGKDGANPLGLAADQSGSLYGVTTASFGKVFSFTEGKTSKWTKKNIYGFRAPNQENASTPRGGVVIDQSGNVYGLAGGGKSEDGALYELAPQSDGKYVETLLYSFKGGSDGVAPNGPPIIDWKGNLYAVTAVGGGTACGGSGCGTVFEVSP